MFKKYFYGNEISEYGREHGFVDYATLAKAFDAVLNNNLINCELGYFEKESGFIDNSERIEEEEEKKDFLQAQYDSLEELASETENEILYQIIDRGMEKLETAIEKIEETIYELEDAECYEPDIFQWYIVSDSGAEILKEFNEIVYYNSDLDIYLWGITHYGTSWSYVLTNIPCEKTR